jgi:hypothetical protein
VYTSTASTRPKFVRPVRRYRTIEIQAGARTTTAVGSMPADLRTPLRPHPGFSTRIRAFRCVLTVTSRVVTTMLPHCSGS